MHQTDRAAARRVWAALERAEPAILERLEPQGIVDVEYIVGFVHPFKVDVVLVTDSDAERDALGNGFPFLEDVAEALSEVGFPAKDASLETTTVQSQETVDREYEGSWFDALR